MVNAPTSRRPLWLGCVLLLALPLLVVCSVAYGDWGSYSLASAMRVVLTDLGLLPAGSGQEILQLRLLRALCAVAVGGSLALAGALAQGLFRNPLADPGLLGVGSGATVGAVLGIALLGGYGPDWTAWARSSVAAGGEVQHTGLGGHFAFIMPLLSLAGALLTAFAIYRFATRQGRISVPMLLLTGLAVNSLLTALMASIQVLLLEDYEVSRAIVAWGFGTLDDRMPFHLYVAGGGALVALASIPVVGLELDLLAGGEEDAASLGADPARIKPVVLTVVALATAAAVSVSGQIAFVGLLVPHLIRMLVGPHHRVLLPLSFLAGAMLLLSVVVFQHSLCPLLAGWSAEAHLLRIAFVLKRITVLQPGVLTALLGAPFFMYLLLRQTRGLRW